MFLKFTTFIQYFLSYGIKHGVLFLNCYIIVPIMNFKPLFSPVLKTFIFMDSHIINLFVSTPLIL